MTNHTMSALPDEIAGPPQVDVCRRDRSGRGHPLIYLKSLSVAVVYWSVVKRFLNRSECLHEKKSPF